MNNGSQAVCKCQCDAANKIIQFDQEDDHEALLEVLDMYNALRHKPTFRCDFKEKCFFPKISPEFVEYSLLYKKTLSACANL